MPAFRAGGRAAAASGPTERWPSAAAHMVSLDIAEELGGSWGFRPSLRALPACWPQVFVPCGAPTNPPVDPHESLNFQLLGRSQQSDAWGCVTTGQQLAGAEWHPLTWDGPGGAEVRPWLRWMERGWGLESDPMSSWNL